MKIRNRQCPVCGEPARTLRGTFRANREVFIDADGSVKFGRVLYSRSKVMTDETVELECGGGHRWQAKVKS